MAELTPEQKAEQDRQVALDAARADERQKAIDEVVKRERREADRRVADLQTRLDSQDAELVKFRKPGQHQQDDDEAFKRKVAEARKPVEDELALERKKAALKDRRIALAELKAAASDTMDADLVAEQLVARVKVTEDGALEVIDKDGKPEYGASGLKTPRELVTEFVKGKPYLVKGRMRDGLGNLRGGGDSSAPAGSPEAQIEALQQEIAELESDPKTAGQASPLKIKVARLARQLQPRD